MNKITLDHNYHTPNRDVQPGLLKIFSLPVAIPFYLGIFKVVWETCSLAKRGLLDTTRLIEQSRGIFRVVEKNGGHFHLEGFDYLGHTEGPVVLVSNHMSTLETFLFPCLVSPFKDFAYVLKQDLLNYPLLGKILVPGEPIAVSRKNPREDLKKVLEEGSRILSSGRSMLIFPQSTRTRQMDATSFNTLGIKLAKRVNVPIIPVALKTDFWGTGRLLRDFGPIGKTKDIFFSFGEPINIQGDGKKEHQEIINFISSHLEDWSSR